MHARSPREHHSDAAPSFTTPAPGPVQRKSALRGMGYADQVAALSPVQAHGGASGAVHQAAAHGISGSSGPLPHGEAIQASFGRHDVSNVQAHTDSKAQQGASAMGADAYATGSHVAFAGSPDLHTAAHEAAHVVQQRAGVQLKGGVGQVGDAYEQHADAVADRVVQGKSAEGLLDQMAGGSGGGAPVQMRGNKAARKFANADWNGLPTTRAHVMNGELNADRHPTGLHAYTGGGLPGGRRVLKTVGSEGSIHFVWWTMDGAGDRCKWSSMFPSNFTEGMVTAVLQHANTHASNDVDGSALGLPYGGVITVGTAGNTMYPVKDHPADTDAGTLRVNDRDYTVTNHT